MSISTDTADIEDLKPCVPFFGPCNLKNLQPNTTKLWCRCGLSKTQPWCDGKSHIGTGFQPLKWVVPEKNQSMYAICNCKYTKSPPYCDATHTLVPIEIYNRQKNCSNPHDDSVKLCVKCGWTKEKNLLD
ncbi:hypothetical protein BKA69DRAFT_1117002 [Paraphysoderma sedebokerense]|nr:hypothetical protein BKA69DRAFT_1117002 [Paraphysoderma sedebokerense]